MTDTDTDHETNRMRDVSHTNPTTGRSAGDLFGRGRTVVADGGRGESEPTEDAATMKEVSHTPPHDADGANRAFERGDPEGASEK